MGARTFFIIYAREQYILFLISYTFMVPTLIKAPLQQTISLTLSTFNHVLFVFLTPRSYFHRHGLA